MILSWPQFQWLLAHGVPAPHIVYPCLPEHHVDGEGRNWLHFPDDDFDWQPRLGLTKGGWCLGEDAVYESTTYWNGAALRIFETPLDWLKAGRTGVVIRDWSYAFDRLRDVPRVSVPKALATVYKKAMRPVRVPELAIIP